MSQNDAHQNALKQCFTADASSFKAKDRVLRQKETHAHPVTSAPRFESHVTVFAHVPCNHVIFDRTRFTRHAVHLRTATRGNDFHTHLFDFLHLLPFFSPFLPSTAPLLYNYDHNLLYHHNAVLLVKAFNSKRKQRH